jgi:hypothetical protein
MNADLPTPIDESLETTLRQILQQKWSNIEHYDRQDQNFLVSVFALAGAAVTLGKLEKVDQEILTVAYWFAALLSAGAIVAVLRSFVEYYRSIGVICRVEQALRVYEIVGERPSFPNEHSFITLFVGLAAKLLRTWRVFLLATYSVIGVTAFSFASKFNWPTSCAIWFAYLLITYTWLTVFPMRKSSIHD